MDSLVEMNVTNWKGTMDDAEWSLARLYMALVLVKVGDPDPALEDPAVLEAIARAEGVRLLSVLLGFSFCMPRLSCFCQQFRLL